MNIHIYVNVPVLVWSINGPEFGRKVPAMEYHKKAKLCLWKRSFSGLLIGDWDKRKKKERERERGNPKPKKRRKKKKEKIKKFFFFLVFFFFFACPPPPPESSQVITSLYLRLGRGGGHAKKKKKKKKKKTFFFFFFWVLDFGFSLSLSLSFCAFLWSRQETAGKPKLVYKYSAAFGTSGMIDGLVWSSNEMVDFSYILSPFRTAFSRTLAFMSID